MAMPTATHRENRDGKQQPSKHWCATDVFATNFELHAPRILRYHPACRGSIWSPLHGSLPAILCPPFQNTDRLFPGHHLVRSYVFNILIHGHMRLRESRQRMDLDSRLQSTGMFPKFPRVARSGHDERTCISRRDQHVISSRLPGVMYQVQYECPADSDRH